MPANHQNIRNH